MRATSLRRTTEPSAFDRTTTSPNSSAVCRRPRARTVSVCSWPGGRRRGSHLPGRVDGALLLDGLGQIRHGEAELREHVRLHPDAHGVVGGAEDEHLADAGHAQQRVDEVDVRVVPEEQRVARLLRRVQRHGEQRQAGGLADQQAELVHLGRQVGLRLREPVLDVHLVGVDVGVRLERDLQLRRAVVGVDRLHVQHVVHAVHLLLDRRGDGLLERHRIGARVGGGDEQLRRDDLRILRDRQGSHRHEADDDGDDRDDDGDDGTGDEELRHGVTRWLKASRTVSASRGRRP